MTNEPSGEIILYQREDGKPAIDVRLDGETVWLTQAQIGALFQTTPQNITLHLKAIYAEGELSERATCKDYLQVPQEGKRQVSRTPWRMLKPNTPNTAPRLPNNRLK